MAVGGAVSEAPRLCIQVPKDAIPGTTQLRVPNENKDLIVTVPAEAAPEDFLLITEVAQQELGGVEENTGWQVSILPAHAAEASGLLAPKIQAPAPPQIDHGAGEEIVLFQAKVDPVSTYTRMVEAARLAGGYVNPKLDRAVIPEIPGMVGMVANSPIAKGEEIARMPWHLHISVRTLPTIMPELFKQVSSVDGLMAQLEKDMQVAACVTKLLAEAVDRIEKNVALVPSGDVSILWACYMDQLLGEDWSNHPNWRWVENGKQTLADMFPSPEGPHCEFLTAECLRSFRLLKRGIDSHLAGPKFNAGLFLHARLSMLSRVFHAGHGSSLVPCVDLFNHSNDPTCDWVLGDDAMVLTANRDHAVGEQLWITYGFRPNPILLRTYGFTLPPHMEPSWSCVFHIPVNGTTTEIYDKYLGEAPQCQVHASLHLDTRLVQESLIDCLNACAAGGHDAAEFVMELCTRTREDYERDAMLQPALAALRRARAKSPCSAKWWDELQSEESPSEPSAWRDACVSCKMSEYLCLTSHIEICEFAAGKISEEQCLESVVVRTLLVEAFSELRRFGRFQLITSPVK